MVNYTEVYDKIARDGLSVRFNGIRIKNYISSGTVSNIFSLNSDTNRSVHQQFYLELYWSSMLALHYVNYSEHSLNPHFI